MNGMSLLPRHRVRASPRQALYSARAASNRAWSTRSSAGPTRSGSSQTNEGVRRRLVPAATTSGVAVSWLAAGRGAADAGALGVSASSGHRGTGPAGTAERGGVGCRDIVGCSSSPSQLPRGVTRNEHMFYPRQCTPAEEICQAASPTAQTVRRTAVSTGSPTGAFIPRMNPQGIPRRPV